MRPTARSLVLDLLSTLRRGSMPVRALLESAALFDVDANAVRVAISRLLAEGLVERDERGRYRLGAGAGAIQRRVSAWRDLDAALRRWDGGFLAALGVAPPRAPRAARARSLRALHFLGFRPFEAGLHLRPNNLEGGVAAARETLLGLGLAPDAHVFALHDLAPEADARARRLWDARALRSAARAARLALERSERRLPRLTPAARCAESFRVGGHALRCLALDPLLPDEICAGDERRALAAAMRRYDRIGRAAWKPFMTSHGVVAERGAQDVRVAEAADVLAAAGGTR